MRQRKYLHDILALRFGIGLEGINEPIVGLLANQLLWVALGHLTTQCHTQVHMWMLSQQHRSSNSTSYSYRPFINLSALRYPKIPCNHLPFISSNPRCPPSGAHKARPRRSAGVQ